MPVLNDEIRDAKSLTLSQRERRELAFYYGGDYELLFTLDKSALEDEAVLQKLEKDVNLSIIGKITPPEESIYFKKGEEKELMETKGYQPF